MTDNWFTETSSTDDETEETTEEEAEDVDFERELRTAVSDGGVTDISIERIGFNVQGVDDETLLRNAWMQESRDEAKESYRTRLEAMGVEFDHDEADEAPDGSESDVSDSEAIEGSEDAEDSSDAETVVADAHGDTGDSDGGNESSGGGTDGEDENPATPTDIFGGLDGVGDGIAEGLLDAGFDSKEEVRNADPEELTEVAYLTEDLAHDLTDTEPSEGQDTLTDEEEQTVEDAADALAEQNGGEIPETEEVDVSESQQQAAHADGSGATVDGPSVPGNALSRDSAVEKDRLWRILVWAEPGLGKTHFAYTSPKPLLYIDTENKGDELAHKFEDIPDNQLALYQPDNWNEAKQALEEGREWLTEWHDEHDIRGTVVVDSITDLWAWSKQQYVTDYWGADPDVEGPEDVSFKSGMAENVNPQDSDWKMIRRYHSERFRDVITQSPFHAVFTARSKDAYGKQIEEGLSETPKKPDGEKNNGYEVNHILRLVEGSEGETQGYLEKSNFVQHQFGGLGWPTFDKVRDIVNDIEDAELDPDPVQPGDVTDADVDIVTGKPQWARAGATEDDDD